MVHNVGRTDRIIRAILGVILFFATTYFQVSLGIVGVILLGIVSAVLVVSAAYGLCPLYILLGISTEKQVKSS